MADPLDNVFAALADPTRRDIVARLASGDATVGEETNIGAGTITGNYDGKLKHPTTIGSDAFIGSDTIFVAPVSVGDGARTGAGAVVTRDVAPGDLVVGVPARSRHAAGTRSDGNEDRER